MEKAAIIPNDKLSRNLICKFGIKLFFFHYSTKHSLTCVLYKLVNINVHLSVLISNYARNGGGMIHLIWRCRLFLNHRNELLITQSFLKLFNRQSLLNGVGFKKKKKKSLLSRVNILSQNVNFFWRIFYRLKIIWHAPQNCWKIEWLGK